MDATVEPTSGRPGEANVAALVEELSARLAGFRTVEDPAREARALLAALLDVPLFWPSLNAARSVEHQLRARALRAAAMRGRGAPLAYCVGRAPFRHLTLDVDEQVLIPRPETEQLVDVAMAVVGTQHGGVAVDIGTGSGAIALALASEAAFDRVIGTDVSLDALEVARRNAHQLRNVLRVPVELRHGSLLAPVDDVRPRLVISNPPYVASSEALALPSSVRDWEPPVALVSGRDGMRVTAPLVWQAAECLAPGGVLALEVDSRRAGAVANLTAADLRFIDVSVKHDLAGRERFVVARRKEDA
ncbi:MAG: peptide chain release factor N(5)-glutamine methyltransferase [Gemmatimonadaceae bacterium]